jgi:S-DNA-T family DNA segregation ATPase FtsK/SpoIIIE
MTKAIIKKLLGLQFLAIGLFLLLSISSYNAADPSFNSANSNMINNLGGYYGAYIADPLIQAFGFSIFIPIFFLITYGIKAFTKKPVRYVFLRVLSLFIVIPLFATSLANFFTTTVDKVYYGGFVGSFLSFELLNYHDSIYLNIGILILALFGLLLSINLSFAELVNIVNRVTNSVIAVYNFFSNIYFLIRDFIERFKTPESTIANESPKIANNVEIVSQAPKAERRVRVQSKLKLSDDEFELPPIELLRDLDPSKKQAISDLSLSQNSKILQQVLGDFGIRGDIVKIHPGPVVTLYEFEPAAGIKSSRVIGLADDISRSMSAISARISVVAGKSSLGIELPNSVREMVLLRELLITKEYLNTEEKLPLVLGKSIGGEPIIADLAKMPHLLVAGTTGSGKSVAINTMILSLLYKHSPKACRFIMIDPKMLELSVYDGIPHMLAPVVTDPKKAIAALKWVVKEMENRYKVMSTVGVRNIDGYNKELLDSLKTGKKFEKKIQVGFDAETGKPKYETITLDTEPLPYIVVIVDEMADLMLVAGKDIESSIQRLAQMARAAGIHLIMATQRPSVDVITGVIKANLVNREPSSCLGWATCSLCAVVARSRGCMVHLSPIEKSPRSPPSSKAKARLHILKLSPKPTIAMTGKALVPAMAMIFMTRRSESSLRTKRPQQVISSAACVSATIAPLISSRRWNVKG